jgi:hypothetical protein
MRIAKITKTAIVAAAAFTMAVAPAFAAVNDTSVINSGDHVDVNSSTNTSSTVAVTNTNTATVKQHVDAAANTGGNDANGNISLGGAGATINTGAAAVNTALEVQANQNETAIAGGNNGTTNLTDVVNTGDGLDVNTSANNANVVAVSNDNYAKVFQGVDAYANTGKNDANNNIGGGTINTSGAAVGTELGVAVNKNQTAVGGVGAGSLTNGSLVNATSATNTGDWVDVNSSANNSNTVAVANSNSLFSAQYIDAYSNTGKNDANSNIGGGSIGTGPAGVVTGASVAANHNMTGIAGWMGELSLSGNLSDVVNTGDKLDSNTSVNNTASFVVTNANEQWSHQSAYETSSSGYNDANFNIGHAGIGTGVAGVGTGLGLLANHNATGIGWIGSLLGWLSM